MDMREYIETESNSVGDESADALRERLRVIKTSKPALDEVTVETVTAARAAGVTWGDIADLLDIAPEVKKEDRGRRAQMWHRRAIKTPSLDLPDTTEGLSAENAAAQFGVSRPTFIDHLRNPESEIAKRTKVIEGVFKGRKVPRYVIDSE